MASGKFHLLACAATHALSFQSSVLNSVCQALVLVAFEYAVLTATQSTSDFGNPPTTNRKY